MHIISQTKLSDASKNTADKIICKNKSITEISHLTCKKSEGDFNKSLNSPTYEGNLHLLFVLVCCKQVRFLEALFLGKTFHKVKQQFVSIIFEEILTYFLIGI